MTREPLLTLYFYDNRCIFIWVALGAVGSRVWICNALVENRCNNCLESINICCSEVGVCSIPSKWYKSMVILSFFDNKKPPLLTIWIRNKIHLILSRYHRLGWERNIYSYILEPPNTRQSSIYMTKINMQQENSPLALGNYLQYLENCPVHKY